MANPKLFENKTKLPPTPFQRPKRMSRSGKTCKTGQTNTDGADTIVSESVVGPGGLLIPQPMGPGLMKYVSNDGPGRPGEGGGGGTTTAASNRMKSKFFREATQKRRPTLDGIGRLDGKSPSEMKPFSKFKGMKPDSPLDFTPMSQMG